MTDGTTQAPKRQNKIRFGLSKLTIFFEKDGGGYDDPIKIPGVTQCSHSPQVNKGTFFADNVLWWQGNADTGDEITVSTAFFPDSVLAKMLGWKIDSKGALVRVANGTPCSFAMAYQVEGDAVPRAKVVYSCTASIPGSSAETKGETITPQTEEMSIRSKAIVHNGDEMIETVLNESDDAEAFAAFFDAVYMPTYTTAPTV